MTLVVQKRRASGNNADARADSEGGQGIVTLNSVSWDLYDRLRRETDAAHSHVRMTFNEGTLTLMAPLPIHDQVGRLIGRLIQLFALFRDIPIQSLGTTTWRRRSMMKGLEADECYYVGRQVNVPPRDYIDLSKNPPPDLAVEVDITHHPSDRLAVYAGVRVPEVWRFDGERIVFLRLRRDGKYRQVTRSAYFALLTPQVVQRHIDMLPTMTEHEIVVAFRNWVESLPPS